MKRHWLLAMLWAVLCLGGSLWSAIGLQSQLQTVAATALAEKGEPFHNMSAVAIGQTIVLSGKANRESEVERAVRLMSEQVRLPGVFDYGTSHNPVLAVTSEILLEPRPEGWGLLAVTSATVRLRGIAGSENEANRVGISVRSAGQLTRGFVNEIMVDGEAFLESDQLETTINSTPTLTSEVIRQGMLAATRWGQKWQVLDVTKPAETLRRDITALGLPPDAWGTGMFAEIERVRDARAAFNAVEKEKARLAGLPPGHVVLALRGSQILLHGELGTVSACGLLESAVKLGSPERVIIDELVSSTHRKPGETSKLLVSTLPALPSGLFAKLVAIGTPDTGWKVIDLATVDIEDLGTITQSMLPEGLDLRLALPDLITSITWVNSIQRAPMQQDGTKTTPYFMVAAVGDHVYVRGAVAEEAVRTQVEAAARRVYANRLLDMDVRLDGTCMHVEQALQTLSTMPSPPALDSLGIIAFAFSGNEWHSKPAHLRLLEPAGLQQSGLLPTGVPVNALLPDVLSIAPAVKAHIARHAENPPGIPTQPTRQP